MDEKEVCKLLWDADSISNKYKYSLHSTFVHVLRNLMRGATQIRFLIGLGQPDSTSQPMGRTPEVFNQNKPETSFKGNRIMGLFGR